MKRKKKKKVSPFGGTKVTQILKKQYVDLNSFQGNTFHLMALAKKLCKELDLNFALIHEELTAGDYEDLLVVFEKHFGEFVTLYK